MTSLVAPVLSILALLVIVRLPKGATPGTLFVPGAIVAAVLSAAAFLIARMPSLAEWEGRLPLQGVAIGALLAILAGLVPDVKETRFAVGLTLGVLGIGLLNGIGIGELRTMALGMLGGLALVALLLPNERWDGVILGSTLAAFTHLFALGLAAKNPALDPSRLPTALMLVWVLMAVAGVLCSPGIRSVVRTVVGLAGITFVLLSGQTLIQAPLHVGIGLIGFGAVSLIAWAIPARALVPSMLAGAALLLLGLCTVASGWGENLGVALFLFAACTAVLGWDREDLIPVLAPVFVIVLFKLMREFDVEALRSIDLGQYYAVFGLVAGLLFGQLGGSMGEKWGRLCRTAMGAVVIILLAASLILMGGKGSVGLMIGAALSLLWTVPGSSTRLAPVSIFGLALALHPMLMPYAVFDKEAKLSILIWFFVAAAAFGLTAWATGRNTIGKPSNELV